MGAYMRQTGRRTAISGLIGFELLTKAACLSLGFPAVREAIKLCIRLSGYSYVTKENVSAFLKKPFTMFFLFLFLSLFSLLAFYEMCAVSLALCRKEAGIRVTALELFYGALDRAGGLLRRGYTGILTMFFSLLFVLFVDSPMIIFLMLGLKQTEGMVKRIVSPAGIVLILLAVFILWWIALFGCAIVLIPEISGGTNLKQVGKRLFFGYKRLLFGLLKRSILLFGMEAGIYIAGLFGMVCIIRRAVSAATATVVLLHTFERFHLIICLVFATINAVICEIFCAGLFYEKNTGEAAKKVLEEPALQEGCLISRTKKILFGTAVASITISCAVSTFFFFRNRAVFLAEALGTVNITAHRGASLVAPENSLSAIKRAISDTADYVELDVRLTMDEIPVLSHDASLYRMTGTSRYIWNMTYEEVSVFDIGRRFGPEFAGEHIPSLREVFERYGGEVGFNLDLKPYGNDALADRVVELIKEYHVENSCVITSTSQRILERVKELDAGIKTGYILSFVYGDFQKNGTVDFFSIHSGFITDDVVRQAHAVGKEIHAWTVNKEVELLRLKTMGVDNIITDDPAFARKIVYDEGVVDTIEEWMRLLFPKK